MLLICCGFSASALIGRRLLHTQQPSPDAVQKQLEAQLQTAPPATQQAHAAGLAALQRGEYSSAERSFTAALAADSTLALDWFQLGVVYSNTKRPEPALRAFQQATELEPAFASAWYNIGLVQTDRTALQAAKNALQQAVRLDPDFVLARLALARVYLKTGESDAATQQAREAVRRQPHAANAWLGLGDTLAERADAQATAEALRCFQRAEAMQPDAYSAFRYGQMALRLNQPSRAAPALTRATRLDPTNPTPWYLLARAQAALGQAVASATLQKAHQVRQWAHDEKMLNVAIEQRPSDAALYFQLGATQARQGATAAAIHSYQRGLSLASANTPTRHELQVLLSRATRSPNLRQEPTSSALGIPIP